jgi:DNA-binding response OmpR family regulator
MTLDPNIRINLSRIGALAMETSQYAVDTLGQILKGFDVGELHRCLTIEDAEAVLRTKTIDLILIDPSLGDGAGYPFIRNLRASGREPQCIVPILALIGQATPRDVSRCRDVGCNLIVAKPITPASLIQRIDWIIKDPRSFIAAPNYAGPDRRFKFEGPPPDSDGRRADDKPATVGAAQAPNLSQADLDSFFKPQKVSL